MDFEPKTVVFRADASAAIGSGHVRRCLALAEAFRASGAQVTFVSRAGAREAVPALTQSFFPSKQLPARGSEAEALADVIEGTCSLLVVDHYGLDADFERACRRFAKNILVIDDLADRPHECDMLVDQTPGRHEADYTGLVPEDCVVLAGAGYAMLDKSFRRARVNRGRAVDTIRRVLVSFGGSDLAGATVLALEALRRADLGVAVDVVVGSPGGDFDLICNLAASLEPAADVHAAVTDMASLVARADMAIGAGGISALERCCAGLPSVIVAVAKNQLGLADALARAGAARVMGAGTYLSSDALADVVRDLAMNPASRERMRHAAALITDGYGAERVAAVCLPLPRAKNGGAIYLRRATIDDEGLMLDWQSAPGARIYSRNPLVPEPSEHRAWLKRKLADPQCIFSVVLFENCPAGILRLDALPDGGHEVSILIAAEFQGKHIGGGALEIAKRLVPHSFIYAEIHPENAASIRMFERAGYRKLGRHWTFAPIASATGD